MTKEKKSIKKDVGARFNQFRKKLNKTQQQFANELSIYQSTITNFEQGRTFPSLNYLFHFHERYGLNITWLITGKGEMIFKDYQILNNAASISDRSPGYTPQDQKSHHQLLYLLEIPVFEQIIMAKFLEVKKLLKDEIEEFYRLKNPKEKKESSNGDEI
jgi:transcriptional regulator with XRE-family HTH domain